MESKATVALEVKLPIEVVELKVLKTNAGEPVRVQCERVDELTMLRITEALPGNAVKSMEKDVRTTREKVDEMMKVAGPLLEAGAFLINPDGSVLRPSFWAGEPQGPGVPVRLLSVTDITIMFNALMMLSGYAGGVVEDSSFPGGNGEGNAGGAGASHGGEGVREDAVGDAARPDAGVQHNGAQGGEGGEAVPDRQGV